MKFPYVCFCKNVTVFLPSQLDLKPIFRKKVFLIQPQVFLTNKLVFKKKGNPSYVYHVSEHTSRNIIHVKEKRHIKITTPKQ